MDRSAVYTGEIPRSYDLLKGWRRAYVALGFSLTDSLGGVTDSAVAAGGGGTSGTLGDNLYNLTDHGGVTAASPLTPQLQNLTSAAVVQGFQPVIVTNGGSSGPSSLRIDIGTVYASQQTDAIGNPIPSASGTPTGYGDIAEDLTAVTCQFICPAETFSIANPGSNSAAYLIYVSPEQIDTTAADDPNVSASAPYNAVLPYFNAANPSLPLQGPGGTNPPTQQPSVREATGTVAISSVQTGSSIAIAAAKLTLPVGAIPLYVVGITHNLGLLGANIFAVGLGTAGLANPIITAGASQPFGTGISYAVQAPFLRGLMQQHHLGVAGSAPQIDGGKEWLPLSAVDNNGQAFKDFTYLASKHATGTTVASGASPVSSSSLDTPANDTCGQLSVGFTTGSIGTGVVVLATVTTENGLIPEAVVLTPMNQAAAALIAVGFTVGWAPGSAGTWTLVALNNTGSTFTIGTVTAKFSYVAIF